MQSVSVVVPPYVVQAAARSQAELPLMVQPVSVIVPRLVTNRPPPAAAELPLTVQSVSVVVPPSLYRPPPFPVVEPPDDGQAAEVGRHAAIDLEHPAQPAAADRHARRRARDRLGPARVAQLELARRQRDRLAVAKTVGSKVIVSAPAGHWPG